MRSVDVGSEVAIVAGVVGDLIELAAIADNRVVIANLDFAVAGNSDSFGNFQPDAVVLVALVASR